MNVSKLFQFVVSKAERGLWYDHDERNYDPSGWGFCFKIYTGPMLRPVTKPWYWFKKGIPSMWNEFDPQFHWKIYFPWIPAPFVSVAWGSWGAYFGFKIWDSENPKYRAMTPEVQEWLAPTLSTRSTRWE